MNKENIAAAKAAIDSVHQELAPHISEVNKQILGELALQKPAQEIEAESHHNLEVVRNIADILPLAPASTKYGIRSEFGVQTPTAARAILASGIWLRTWSAATEFTGAGPVGMLYPTIDFAIRPYWIMGRRFRSQHDKEFLLAPAYKDIEHRSDKRHGPYTEVITGSPVRRQLNKSKDGLLILKAAKTDAKKIDEAPSAFYEIPVAEGEAYPRIIDHKAPGATVITMYGRRALHKLKVAEGLTDYDLTSFNVFSNVGMLAVLFNKESQVQRLLTQYQPGEENLLL